MSAHLKCIVLVPPPLFVKRACFSGATSWVEPEAPGALPRSLRHARRIISWKAHLDGRSLLPLGKSLCVVSRYDVSLRRSCIWGAMRSAALASPLVFLFREPSAGGGVAG